MTTYKDKIKKSFNRAKKSYDESCQIQKTICQKLLVLSKPYAKKSNLVVDLGCGTANSTVLLKKNISYKTLYGLDISEKLLDQARTKEKLDDVNFLQCDIENLSFDEGTVSLFFSSMAMQWITNLSTPFKKIGQQLSDNGFFIFSLPIGKTFHELRNPFRHNFYTLNNIVDELKKSKLDIIHSSTETYTLPFSSAFSALKSIKGVGANQLNHTQPKKKGMSTKNNLADFFHDKKKFNLSYEIAYFITKKRNET